MEVNAYISSYDSIAYIKMEMQGYPSNKYILINIELKCVSLLSEMIDA